MSKEKWINSIGERAALFRFFGWYAWWVCDLGTPDRNRAYKYRKCAENYLRRCGYEREVQQ